MIVCKTINNVEYVAEFKGVRIANKIQDECTITKTNRLNIEKFAKKLFDEIIISPKNLTIEDFDKYEKPLTTLYEVIDFAKNVMVNGDDKKLSKSDLKKKVENERMMWRLVLSDVGNFDYDTVFNKMTPQQIQEANIALNIAIKESKKH